MMKWLAVFQSRAVMIVQGFLLLALFPKLLRNQRRIFLHNENFFTVSKKQLIVYN